jgi:Glycosyltransferase family 87
VSEPAATQAIESRPAMSEPSKDGRGTADASARWSPDSVRLGVRCILAGVIIACFVWLSFYDHAADFKTFFSAGYAVRHPEIPLYDLVALEENPFGEVFKLAPPAAVYLVPFSFGTLQQSRLAWRLGLVAAIVAAYVVLTRPLGVEMLGWPWLAGLACWSAFGPLQIAVGEGQWDPIMLLLIAVATAGVVGRRVIMAALALAVAASVKPYPLMLIGHFLARRQWRATAVTLLALAALLIAGALIVGFDETKAFVTRVLPASGAMTAYADNQSLGGVLARFWSSDLKPFPLRDAGPLDLLIRVSAVALFGATIWLVARRPSEDRLQRALHLSLFVPLSILVIPAAWTHYQTILLVPLTVLAVDQARRRPVEPLGWVLLALAYVILLLPNPTMLYGPEIDRGLWLRSRADGANLALQQLYPTAVSRLMLSYKAFGVILLYGLLAWRAVRPASAQVPHDASTHGTVPAGAAS